MTGFTAAAGRCAGLRWGTDPRGGTALRPQVRGDSLSCNNITLEEKIKSKKKVPSATTSEKEEVKNMVRHFLLGQYDIIFQRYFWEPKARVDIYIYV